MSHHVEPSIHAVYQGRIAACEAELTEFSRRNQQLSRWRGLTGLPAIGLAAWMWVAAAPAIWFTIPAVFFIAFLLLVGYHERQLLASEVTRERLRINQEQGFRVQRKWSELPPFEATIAPERMAVARDLDVIGRGSLLQLLGTPHTRAGRSRLVAWLVEGVPTAHIPDHQAAVRSLAERLEFRQALQLRARLANLRGAGPDEFVAWSQSAPWLGTRHWLRRLVRALTLSILLLPLGIPFGIAPFSLFVAASGIILANIIVNLTWGPSVAAIFNLLASRQREVDQYLSLFEMFTELPRAGAKFEELRDWLGGDEREPVRLLGHLARRVNVTTWRHSPLLGIPYVLCQGLFLCDFHLLTWIEGWQRAHGAQVNDWFRALGELEALCALAGLAHDQPTWTFPRVDDAADRFQARGLGHPLIEDGTRVANDVEIGPAGSFLLVSGSNMSGKSTLLRSVGLNVLLARAGGPVCATAATLPPVEIATSMRIGDSLTDGVSFYMAELKRLKEIVDLARHQDTTHGPRLLFLLDEILLGTNSAERHQAVVRVVDFLLSARAIGAISTHDLELATAPELARACRAVHFREYFTEDAGRTTMRFDYRMRDGVATTTNALKLLEMVGLTRQD